MNEKEEFILETVRERTEPSPDGVQNTHSNVWTNRGRLREDGRKDRTPYSADEADSIIEGLIEEGKLLGWHGLLCPTDDEFLKAVTENEVENGWPRRILIGRANQARSEEA